MATGSAKKSSWFGRHKILSTILGVFLFLTIFGALFGEDTPTDPASSSAGGTADHDAVKTEEEQKDEVTAEPEPAEDSEPQTETTEPTKKAIKRTTPKPKPRRFLVTRVIDGDTVELGNGQQVRLLGIDTPERGECGFEKAAANLERLVLRKMVVLGESGEDQDRYGRLLRYVNVGRMDAGLRLIKNGLAIARYDSRDGYGFHPRENVYIAEDKARKNVRCPKPPPPPPAQVSGGGCGGYRPCIPSYPPDLDCSDVSGPIYVTGSDPHELDSDGDGVACES